LLSVKVKAGALLAGGFFARALRPRFRFDFVARVLLAPSSIRAGNFTFVSSGATSAGEAGAGPGNANGTTEPPPALSEPSGVEPAFEPSELEPEEPFELDSLPPEPPVWPRASSSASEPESKAAK
jgi:hypothetical protein